MLPTAKTGLADSYVLYSGSNPGNTGQGGIPQRAMTNTTDELATRNNPSSPVPITSPLDFDRNKQVNTTDSLLARNNAGFLWKIEIGSPELTSTAVVPAAASLAESGEISAGLAARTASAAPIASTPVWHTSHLQRVDSVASSAPQGPATLLTSDGGRPRAVAKSVDRLLANHAFEADALESLLDDLLGR